GDRVVLFVGYVDCVGRGNSGNAKSSKGDRGRAEEKSPSPPFTGFRGEAPVAWRREGEVGSGGDCFVGPPHPPFSPRPAGGEEKNGRCLALRGPQPIRHFVSGLSMPSVSSSENLCRNPVCGDTEISERASASRTGWRSWPSHDRKLSRAP